MQRCFVLRCKRGKDVAKIYRVLSLQPFEVWAVLNEFQLDPQKATSKKIVSDFPELTLNLLAVCISEKQQHGVYNLKAVLDWISEARSDLQHDYRMRFLRKLAVGP